MEKKENRKETDDTCTILLYKDHMKEFGMDIVIMKKAIFPKMEKYKINYFGLLTF